MLTICSLKKNKQSYEHSMQTQSLTKKERLLGSPASPQCFPPALQLPWQRGKEREREVQTSTPRPDSKDHTEGKKRNTQTTTKKTQKRQISSEKWSGLILVQLSFSPCLPSRKITLAVLPWWEAGRLLWHLECRTLNTLPLRHWELWWRRAQNGEKTECTCSHI